MRKAGFILLIAVSLGGIIFWTLRYEPLLQDVGTGVDVNVVHVPSSSPSTDTPSIPNAQKKVVPRAAPFSRPMPKFVPQEALPHPSVQSEERSKTANEAVEYPEVYRSVDELVLVKLDAILGRPATYETLITRSNKGWTYMCGRPLELDRTAFNYTRSRLKIRAQTGAVEDMFCLLAALSEKGFGLKEFSLGASDNPMEDWAEKHSDAQSLIFGAIE